MAIQKLEIIIKENEREIQKLTSYNLIELEKVFKETDDAIQKLISEN